MKLFRDPIWQFIGTVVAVVGIAFTAVIYLKSRPVKRIKVDVLSNSPVVALSSGVSKEVQVLYRGRPFQSLSVILLKFQNTGTEPVKETDYSEPIRISLSPSAEIGEVLVQEVQPAGVSLTATKTASNQVELGKVLLNPGDQAIVRILALDNDTTLVVEARIAGVQRLEIHPALESKSQSDSKNSSVLIVMLVTVVVLVYVSAKFWNSANVVQWRIGRFGYDPAARSYAAAQAQMIQGFDKEHGVSGVVSLLEEAFKWDKQYIARAESDPLFSVLRGYGPYRSMLERYYREGSGEVQAG